MPVAVLVGIPAYLNGYAALGLVSGLVETGMAPGAAMAFLIAGGRHLDPRRHRRLGARASAGLCALYCNRGGGSADSRLGLPADRGCMMQVTEMASHARNNMS